MDTPDVCPPEDAIQTLLEYLVDPLLPTKSSVLDNPSESQQNLVAAQVHAVLLLYNYYHRKQHPHLKDGDFEWFCKLVVANKPALLAYMNLMQRSDDAKLEDLVNQLSITEKQIMDVCDISKSLYALKGVPSTDWPISKVTVFLIDSSRKNCLLQFSSITQGVWSVIEKDIHAPYQSSKGATVTKKWNKKNTTRENSSRDDLSSNEVHFQQLAFSAVEEAISKLSSEEISQTDLMILEGHISYSLCKEKSATCFYIIQCTLSKYDVIFKIPIKDAIDSLQGPLLHKSLSGWMVSPVVEYFHMLPYSGILSDWQSGILSSNSFYSESGLGNININGYKKTEKPRHIEVQEDICGFTGDSVMTEGIDNKAHFVYIDSPENKDKSNGFMSDSSDNLDRPKPDHMVVDISGIGANTKGRTVSSATRLSVSKGKREVVGVGTKISSIKTSDHEADYVLVGHGPNPAVCRIEKVAVGKKSCNMKTFDQVLMRKADPTLVGHQPNPVECRSEKVAVGDGDKICKTKTTDQVRTHKADTAPVGHKSKPKNHGEPQTIEVSTKTYDQIQMRKDDSDIVRHQPNAKDMDKHQTIKVSKEDILSQTALKVLHRRRDRLTLELRSIEDEIAQCDRNIQRISNGSKDDFALKIESIIEGCTDVCFRNGIQERTYERTEEQGIPQYMKRKRLSEAVLNVQSSCQELDGICYENNWILPTYRISSSDGGFEAKASIKGIDFECSSKGCMRSSPSEARESAAAGMLMKLRRMAKV